LQVERDVGRDLERLALVIERRYLEHVFQRRRQDGGHRAEARDQRLGQRLDVAARDGAEQHQLQQFIIGERLGPGLA